MPASTPLTVVIAGGGTGGHLYPGLAVAREIVARDPGARVSFAGTARGIEARVVPKEGFDLDLIRSAGLKGGSVVARARGASLLVPGFADGWRILSRRRPDVVLGVGGYSSGPVVLAAALRGMATMILEQNAVPGLTNRLLARWVRVAAVTYPATLTFFRGRGVVTGNPVRREFIVEAGAPEPTGAPKVLVLGGSLGARAINAAMRDAAPQLASRLPGLSLVHQTGERDLAGVRDAYARAGLEARVEAFLDPVAPEMRSSHLVVCRAGATTLAELAASGRPAILIPWPGAADDHQRQNAQVLADAGGAVLLDERETTPAALADRILELLNDAARRNDMSRAMRRMAMPDAAARIVDRVFALAGRAA